MLFDKYLLDLHKYYGSKIYTVLYITLILSKSDADIKVKSDVAIQTIFERVAVTPFYYYHYVYCFFIT